MPRTWILLAPALLLIPLVACGDKDDEDDEDEDGSDTPAFEPAPGLEDAFAGVDGFDLDLWAWGVSASCEEGVWSFTQDVDHGGDPPDRGVVAAWNVATGAVAGAWTTSLLDDDGETARFTVTVDNELAGGCDVDLGVNFVAWGIRGDKVSEPTGYGSRGISWGCGYSSTGRTADVMGEDDGTATDASWRTWEAFEGGATETQSLTADGETSWVGQADGVGTSSSRNMGPVLGVFFAIDGAVEGSCVL
jgi:hypothetical protein